MSTSLKTYINIQHELRRLRQAGVSNDNLNMIILRDQLAVAYRESTRDGMAGLLAQAERLGVE